MKFKPTDFDGLELTFGTFRPNYADKKKLAERANEKAEKLVSQLEKAIMKTMNIYILSLVFLIGVQSFMVTHAFTGEFSKAISVGCLVIAFCCFLCSLSANMVTELRD